MQASVTPVWHLTILAYGSSGVCSVRAAGLKRHRQGTDLARGVGKSQLGRIYFEPRGTSPKVPITIPTIEQGECRAAASASRPACRSASDQLCRRCGLAVRPGHLV
jgi:hypothetical protein